MTHGMTARQGDALLISIDAIPADAIQVESDGDHVIAHSETGHNHILKSRAVNFFMAPNDPLTGYLDRKAGVIEGYEIT